MFGKMKLELRDYENNNFFTSSCGLLKGESTSPILFSSFIGTKITDILMKVLMFADDTAIFSETREGLQAGLDGLF